MTPSVLTALSGGVDSSVAALLLKERGYRVIGVHLKLWDCIGDGEGIYREGRCCNPNAVDDCRWVCDTIEAPFYVLDMSQIFRREVIDNFVTEYSKGRTPNPCVRCNTNIKWKTLLHKATALGCDYIATGHYASVERLGNGDFVLRKGVDSTRDQSYVLWGLNRKSLSRTLLPLGALRKTEVREIACRYNLKTAGNKESREICFVPDDDYRRFIKNRQTKDVPRPQPGEIVLEDGSVVGRHKGTAYYTIGQRKGLGIAHPKPLYVQRIDVLHNRVIVGENDTLFSSEFIAEQVNWISEKPEDQSFQAQVKIRYRHPPSLATLTCLTDNRIAISFREKQRAITPGQSAVFYEDDKVLGGGIIS